MMLSLALSLLGLCLVTPSLAVPADVKPECKAWSEQGECDSNPEFMNLNCATSCEEIAKANEANAAKIANIESFFDLSANTIEGEVLNFDELEGIVTVITNVASQCGYTDSHYAGLKELHDHFADDFVEVMIFPCNQFGQQEPASAAEISEFCERKGFRGTVMEKIDVNGPNTHPVYLFLKREAGPPSIKWNFATYYVIDDRGNVEVFNGVEPLDLIPHIEELLDEIAAEEEEL
jgi:glutathione peroxidase